MTRQMIRCDARAAHVHRLLPLVLTVVLTVIHPVQAQDPAHDIASKFAADSERATERRRAAAEAARQAEVRRAAAAAKAQEARQKAAEAKRLAERLKADEADMLERARAEADARRQEEERARAAAAVAEQEARQAAQRAIAEKEKQAAEAVVRAAAEEQAVAAKRAAEAREDENRRRAAFAERARQEEERLAREAAQATERAEADRRAAAVASARAAEHAERETAVARDAEERVIEAARRADAARKAMEAEREAELQALTAKLRKVDDLYAADRAPIAEPSPSTSIGAPSPSAITVDGPRGRVASDPEPAELRPATLRPAGAAETIDAAARGEARDDDPPRHESVLSGRAHTVGSTRRVTVLLVMEPGDRGIRRHNKTADPVLCVHTDCYVSNGAGRASRRMARYEALGPFNTLGKRAAACNNALTCVFRDVDLGEGAAPAQPVDLRIMRHDRRSARPIAADTSCEIDSGRLYCANGVDGGTYRLWVVPEPIAREAGARLLEHAVGSGLGSGHRAVHRLQ